MRVASLGSGSRGNATLVAQERTLLMIDCGFGLREIERRAQRLGVRLADLDAILVTHEHSDHTSGVAALARRYGIPVFLTHGTLASGRVAGDLDFRSFDADSTLHIGALTVHAVAVPHDAREPVQYVLESAAHRVGVLTDLGSGTPHVSAAFRGCELLLLEFNHDPGLLAEGPYPAYLKRRVGGAWGHLSNIQAADLLAELDPEGLRQLFVAHISEKNNTRDHVEAVLAERFPALLPRLGWACQEHGFPWFDLTLVTPVTQKAVASGDGVEAY
ncbi:MAG: MBL fold metallo-hydrolase [Pseudomonadota bacterium]